MVLGLWACSEDQITSPQVDASNALTPSFTTVALSQQETPDPDAIADAVPGFAGYFLANGTPTVYLTDTSQRSAAAQALAGWLSSRGFTAASLEVRQAKYDWNQLHAWYNQVAPAALSVPGAVFGDVDEGNNRIRFGGTGAALASLTAAVAGAGIPSDAFAVELASPLKPLADLQTARVRPVVGGYQINFLNVNGVVPGVSLLCTMGFSAISELPPFTPNRSYVTNAHCTGTSGDGATVPMDHYQPLMDPDDDLFVNSEELIGRQVDDPFWSLALDCIDADDAEGGLRLPAPCRWSDASRGEYVADVPFQLGRIARPALYNSSTTEVPVAGGLEIDAKNPTFRIVKEQPFAVLGETVHKVGRTTGWTSGEVIGTCIDYVTDDAFIRRCQATVAGVSAGGDSGSPVFLSTSRKGKPSGKVVLNGILWGGSVEGEPQFSYSPMFNIERELGPLKTY
jgi:hypothetical protein